VEKAGQIVEVQVVDLSLGDRRFQGRSIHHSPQVEDRSCRRGRGDAWRIVTALWVRRVER
jgi:hypothetical protein